ncbi:MAG: hypothetical protein ABFD69_12835 [Candidatus Sumerlaeia bacterium]
MRFKVFWLMTWLVMAPSVDAAVIYVMADAQGATTSGDEIRVAAATYKPTAGTSLSGRALAPTVYVTNGTGMNIPNGGSLRLRSTAPGAPSPTAQLIIRNVGDLKMTLGTPAIATPFKIAKMPGTNVSTGSHEARGFAKHPDRRDLQQGFEFRDQ